jgi:hypothetical protein
MDVFRIKDLCLYLFSFVDREDWYNLMLVCKLCLERGRQAFNPALDLEDSLLRSLKHAHVDSVRLLLKDERVLRHPRFNEYCNSGLFWAAFYGYTSIVQELMTTPKFILYRHTTYAVLKNAYTKGYTDIVSIVLNSSKIDPMTIRSKQMFRVYSIKTRWQALKRIFLNKCKSSRFS